MFRSNKASTANLILQTNFLQIIATFCAKPTYQLVPSLWWLKLSNKMFKELFKNFSVFLNIL